MSAVIDARFHRISAANAGLNLRQRFDVARINLVAPSRTLPQLVELPVNCLFALL